MAKRLRKSGSSFVGWFFSLKNFMAKLPAMTWFDSLSTFFRYYYLEFDLDAIWYKSQPFTKKSTAYRGELHEYTPDVFVQRRTRGLLIECKDEDHINDPHTMQQITIGAAIAEENGWDFLLSIKERLKEGHRLENYKKVYRYARLGIPYDLFQRCKLVTSENPDGMTIAALAHDLAGTYSLDYAPYIYALLYRRILFTDYDAELGPHSIVKPMF